jgi:signal transduction histidine kinase
VPVPTRKRSARVLLLVAAAFPILLAGGAAVFSVVFGQGCAGVGLGDSPSSVAVRDVPVSFLRVYEQVGAQYRLPWEILAGIGAEECDHGRNPDPSCTPEPGERGPGVANCAGAPGPMQVGVGDGRCGVAGDAYDALRRYLADPSPGPHDPTAAVELAALVLIKDKGAPTGQPINAYRSYVRAYNGTGPMADAYADRVLADAHAYQGAGAPASGACSAAVGTPLVPGTRARILPSGDGPAPVDAPAVEQKMIAAGNRIDRFAYSYGGGHCDPAQRGFTPRGGRGYAGGSMRARVPSLLMRPTSPPLVLGIVVAAGLIAAETLVVYPLRQVAPRVSLGVVYLLGVLVVSSVWGLALGVVTAVLSTAAFDFFHVPPVGSFLSADSRGPAALVIFLAVALLLGFVAALARSRAIEAEERRREADLAAEMAGLLLRTDDLRSALPAASARLARTLRLPSAAIELEAVAGGEQRAAFPLRDGDTPVGTLLVPAELSQGMEVRLRERVVPSVEALLRAARDREAMRSALRASRDQLGVLAEEQAALRRVATLVARGAPPDEVFAAVVEEVGRLLHVDFANMGRYEPDETLTIVAAWGRAVEPFPVGSRWTLGGNNLSTIVFETGRAARIDSYADASGPVGLTARETGFRSSVAMPIRVEGRGWGVVIAGSTVERPMPADTESRFADFMELLAMAIANAESRGGLARLAEEQAALRRVATLVARGAPPERVFAAVIEEVVRLLPVEFAGLGHYESDGTMTSVASRGSAVDFFPVGSRLKLGGQNIGTLVFETGRPARIDGFVDSSGPLSVFARERGVRSAVGTPVTVEGRLWGVIAAGSTLEEPVRSDTEARLAKFTELLATAIANAESRGGLARLAEEQAALRRVATLVARAAPPEEVFAAVTEEIGQLLPVDTAGLGRYESDGTITVVAVWSGTVDHKVAVGSRTRLGGKNVSTLVFETGRPARIDNYADASDATAATARETGIRSAVGTPIVVERRLWGVMIAGSTLEPPLPVDTEARLASFTELLATAVANAQSRAELTASRARIVVAADESRRRIERNLHDGAQQQLVTLMLELRAAEATEPSEVGELRAQLADTERGLAGVLEELREISRGIHPAVLSSGGLSPALRALARRSAVSVELDLRAEGRLPEHVEVAAYYVVSEALTNAAKHAHASAVHVELDARSPIVQLAIRDDGVGGADPGHGSGLVGLSDRIEALGGRLQVTSPPGNGTTLLIQIPIKRQSSAGSPEP